MAPSLQSYVVWPNIVQTYRTFFILIWIYFRSPVESLKFPENRKYGNVYKMCASAVIFNINGEATWSLGFEYFTRCWIGIFTGSLLPSNHYGDYLKKRILHSGKYVYYFSFTKLQEEILGYSLPTITKTFSKLNKKCVVCHHLLKQAMKCFHMVFHRLSQWFNGTRPSTQEWL